MLFATSGPCAPPDDRYDYGEDRTQTLGLIGGRLHMLVFTMRGDVLRAISLRKANRREAKLYDEKASTAAP
jgi:uncharacterized DUF497 family protein